MSTIDPIVRTVFSGAASFISALVGYGYHWTQYHNEVDHMHISTPVFTSHVIAAAPWVFLIPLAVLTAGLIWRRHPLIVLLSVHTGWLFAVSWPPLCLLAWALPHVLM
jgi:hypothetical protein